MLRKWKRGLAATEYRCVEVIIKLEVPRLQGTGE